MGSFIVRLFWFILVVTSGLVAALLGATRYGINVDLNSWAKISGLDEITGVTEIIKKILLLLDSPIIKSYGFYGSLALLVVFLFVFTRSLRPGHNNKAEAAHAQDSKAAPDTDDTPDRFDSSADSFGETFDGSSTATEFIAETNSDAVVGTDGKIYDGTATFSGTDTYGHIDSRPEFYADVDSDDGSDDDDEAEGDLLNREQISAADDHETGLSHLTDTELKSKTLDFVEEIRSFETDYQNDRDEIATELAEFANKESLKDALQNVEDTYEQRQTAFASEFKNKYRPEAVAVRHEISKRLGISEPYDNFSPALDNGMLVGANPVTDAADIIEELVKKLA